MGLPVEKRRYTIAEYLALEEKAEERHEFHDGEILAMPGGTYFRSRINTNLLVALGKRLGNHPCSPLDSNMRVRVNERSNYVYPDISIICGEPEFDADDPKCTTILNPRVIVEVLSESTESYDRGEKFELYQRIPSLVEYILVSQSAPLLVSYSRQEDGSWRYILVRGLKSSLDFVSLGLSVPMTEIYDRLTFADHLEG